MTLSDAKNVSCDLMFHVMRHVMRHVMFYLLWQFLCITIQAVRDLPGTQYRGVNENKNTHHDEQFVIFDYLYNVYIDMVNIFNYLYNVMGIC